MFSILYSNLKLFFCDIPPYSQVEHHGSSKFGMFKSCKGFNWPGENRASELTFQALNCGKCSLPL